MRALSTKCRPSVLCGVRALLNDSHAPAVFAYALVLHLARHQRKKRVIAAEPDARARGDLGPALADEDGARGDDLSAVDLDAEHLRVRVAPVARRAAALLVCHLLALLLGAATIRSTRMRSPGATRYCLPPLTTTADSELSGLGTASDCTKAEDQSSPLMGRWRGTRRRGWPAFSSGEELSNE